MQFPLKVQFWGWTVTLVTALVTVLGGFIAADRYFAGRDYHLGDMEKRLGNLESMTNGNASFIAQLRDYRLGNMEQRLGTLDFVTNGNASSIAQLSSRLSANEAAIADLQKQGQLLANKLNAIPATLERLNERMTSIESRLTELSAKLRSDSASPTEKKCAELAQEADTGRSIMGLTVYSPEVIKNALAAMKELGCSSKGIGR